VNKRVAIVGGGLAGLAAAVRLCEAEHEVVLIETRKKLGGRATSFHDPRSHEVLDNCQHVLMGCCTNLMDFYDRIGVLDAIEWHRTLYWSRGDQGERDIMAARWLPAPLHFFSSFRAMKLFDRAEKRAIARAMWRMIRLGRGGRMAWQDRSFEAFLDSCQQPQRVKRAFWNAIVVSACNVPIGRANAAHALQVFQDGFLANKWSYTMGLSRVPLWELYDPAVEFIERKGGRIMLGTSAKDLAYDGKRLTGVVTDEGVIPAAAVIAALPPDRLDKIITHTVRGADTRLGKLDAFSFSPILGVHLQFDQTIMDVPHIVLPEHEVHWLFNKGTDADGHQHLHAVISAADEWMALSESEIVQRVLVDLVRAFPNARGLEPTYSRAVKEKRATFAALPGVDTIRPGALPSTIGLGGGGISNLFLAGDWCDTGWPATMEGAVRSGYAAAAAIAEPDYNGLVEDVPPGSLASMLGLR
jgi:squalene-associated FAD-dependent desaturase